MYIFVVYFLSFSLLLKIKLGFLKKTLFILC